MEHTSHSSGHPLSHNIHNMRAWFHADLGDNVLFDFWRVDNVMQLLISMIMVTVLAFLAEFTRFQLWLVEHRFLKRGVKGYSTFGTVAGLSIKPLWTFGLIYALQLTLGYVSMLIFMTYSIWLGIALCFGGTAGFCYFEYHRRVIKQNSLLK